MAEVLAKMRMKIPEEHRMEKGKLMPYIIGGAVLMTLSMVAVKFIPETLYYGLGGFVILALCAFFWWVGNDRDRLASVWDKVISCRFHSCRSLWF